LRGKCTQQSAKEQNVKAFVEIVPGVEIYHAAVEESAIRIFSDQRIAIGIREVHRALAGQRRQLLADRRRRQLSYDLGASPEFESDFHPCHQRNWRVAPIPSDLMRRRVEITGPVNNRKMVVQMLGGTEEHPPADTAMLDFEDSMQPSWSNLVDGYLNVLAVADQDLAHIQKGPEGEKVYRLNPQRMALPMIRLRGMHLEESNILIDGQPASASILDLFVCASLSARKILASGKTAKYYVPKTEHYLEARWWNWLFQATEDLLQLERGCLRVTLLIETLPAAFQMEEILYEVRERACGLNGGRWDKIFSDIKVLRYHPDRIPGDRSSIDMSCSWMDHYARLLIRSCHRHGAFAMGGMSAFTPGHDQEHRSQQTEKVLADKAREAAIGHDGCWVSHPYFVAIARQAFSRDNQLEVLPDDLPRHPSLLPEAIGEKTIEGLRKNVRVALAYLEGWNRGIGCIAFEGLMEDLATLEISRAQTWQWLHHGVALDSGERVTRGLVNRIFDEECASVLDLFSAGSGSSERNAVKARLEAVKKQAVALFAERELRDFLTITSDFAVERRAP
jgi:malate synthase